MITSNLNKICTYVLQISLIVALITIAAPVHAVGQCSNSDQPPAGGTCYPCADNLTSADPTCAADGGPFECKNSDQPPVGGSCYPCADGETAANQACANDGGPASGPSIPAPTAGTSAATSPTPAATTPTPAATSPAPVTSPAPTTNTSSNGNTTIAFLNPLNASSLAALLQAILQFIVTIGSILLTAMIIIVGFQFVLARGNDEKIKDARRNLKYTIFGGILLLGAAALAGTIAATIGTL